MNPHDFSSKSESNYCAEQRFGNKAKYDTDLDAYTQQNENISEPKTISLPYRVTNFVHLSFKKINNQKTEIACNFNYLNFSNKILFIFVFVISWY